MALEKVVIEYDAEITKLKAKLSETEKALRGVEATGKKAAQGVQDGVDGLEKRLNSFASNTLKNLTTGLVAAFAVDRIIAFGKASVEAFEEQEKVLLKLKFQLVSINGETERTFNRLVKQAETMQKKFGLFSDDAIENGQVLLAQFGLTGKQIESLIPKISDFAALTGRSFEQATGDIIDALKGRGLALKDYQIKVESTGTTIEKLASIEAGLSKTFKDGSEIISNNQVSAFGKLKQSIDPVIEVIGELIFHSFVPLIETTKFLTDAFAKLFSPKVDGFFIELEKQVQKKNVTQLTQELAGFIIKQKEASDAFSDAKFSLVKDQELINETANEYLKLSKIVAIYNDALKGLAKEEADKVSNAPKQIKTVDDLRAKIKELEEQVGRSNITDGESLRLSALLNKAKDDLIHATGGLTDAEKKEAEERKKAAEKLATERGKEIEFNRKRQQDRETKITEDGEKARLALVMQGIEMEEEAEEEAAKKEIKRQEDVTNAKIKLQEEALSAVASITDAFFERGIQNIEEDANTQKDLITEQTEAELADEQRKLDQKLISQQQFNDFKTNILQNAENKRKQIDADADKQQRELKTKQAEAAKAFAAFRIIIDTARAIVAALAESNPVLAVIAGVTGALQLAAVLATPIPAFKEGVIGLQGAGTETSDSILMRASKGESVMTADETKLYNKDLWAMRKGNYDDYIFKEKIVPYLKKAKSAEESFAQNIANSMALNNSFDDERIVRGLKPLRNVATSEDIHYLAKVMQEKSDPRKF